MDLMLKGDWPGNFRRSVRDDKGEILRTLEFSPGKVYDLEDEDLEAVRADIGICLLPVEVDERKGRHRPVNDPELLHELNPKFVVPPTPTPVPVEEPTVSMDVDSGDVDESIFDGGGDEESGKRKKRKP